MIRDFLLCYAAGLVLMVAYAISILVALGVDPDELVGWFL